MRIYQMVASLNFGDAIGNDVIAIKHVIEDMGISTCIYAFTVSDKIREDNVFTLEYMPKLKEDDIVLYHMGNGSPLNEMVADLNCRKIMMYHNITPPEFFSIDSPNSASNCQKGLMDMRNVMKGRFTSYIAASNFNKSDMINMGYNEKDIEVIPIIVPFDDYKQTPDAKMVEKLSDGITNIVFVGRIAPNKKHEDIIRAFAYYKENVNPDSRLILVGSSNPSGMYYNDILGYIDALGVKDVVFPGHISFAEILAIYKTADVFLCMSEHEGFCVPLVEAMTFDVPVIAYDACAVPETLGGSGVVVDDKDPVFLSKVINEVVTNKDMRESIIKAQRSRLKDFEYDTIKKQIQDYITRFLEKYPPVISEDPDKPYREIYGIVEKNMRKSGKDMQFTYDALNAVAKRESEYIDVTELLDEKLTLRSLIETAHLKLLNTLPTNEDYAYWEEDAKKYTRGEFVKVIVSTLANSENRINAGTKVKFDPFSNPEYIEPEAPEDEEGGEMPV